MSEHHELIQTPPVESPAVEHRQEAQPIESRFLFVDVSAMRAKQLRKGAKVRLDDDHPRAIKPERVAMDEVRNKLVEWQLPAFDAVIDPK
jgi:DNA-directed RNA polymerase subunit K/omega